MPDEGYEVDILSILRSIVFEKSFPLLEGKTPDSKFIASNNLSFRFTTLQLALIDIGLFFTFAEISGGSFSAMEDLYIFLLAMNIVVVLMLYFMVSRTNNKLTNEQDGYWYVLKFPFCKSCKVEMVSNEDALFHKIENPQHMLRKFEVRVKINETSKFLGIFRAYELIPLVVTPLFLSLFGRVLYPTIFALLILSLYVSIPVIYIFRYLRRKSKENIFRYLLVKNIGSYPEISLEIFTFRLILIDKRYLRKDTPNPINFPCIMNMNGDIVYLTDSYKTNFYGNVKVNPFSGLSVGYHLL